MRSYGKTGDLFKWQEGARALGRIPSFHCATDGTGVQPGDSCLLAVMTDNSDDKNFPPGKRQYTLDFAYHGGIYRDVWMIGKSSVAITDALEADKVAGGGVLCILTI